MSEKITVSGSQLLRSIFIIAVIFTIMHLGEPLLLPVVVAILIATLLDKPTTALEARGLPQWASIMLTVLLTVVCFLALSWLITRQISHIADDWGTIQLKAEEKLGNLRGWARNDLGINVRDYLDHDQMVRRLGIALEMFAASLTNLASQSFIILVYVILLLMQKGMFHKFLEKLLDNERVADSILSETSRTIRKYLFGKGKLMALLLIIYYVGFRLGGVPYALFLALFATLFSIIPYIGNLIGGGVAVVLAYLYSGITPALVVVGVITLAQLLENYVLTPWIIGDEIDLNPFITVFGIVLLSAIWGLVGAIIALPIIGVIKDILKHIKGMDPYVYLLTQGEEDPAETKLPRGESIL